MNPRAAMQPRGEGARFFAEEPCLNRTTEPRLNRISRAWNSGTDAERADFVRQNPQAIARAAVVHLTETQLRELLLQLRQGHGADARRTLRQQLIKRIAVEQKAG